MAKFTNNSRLEDEDFDYDGFHDSAGDMLKFQAELWRIGEGYILFILCIIGFLGNLLALMTFSTKAIRTTTTSLYLRSLAVADIFVLITAVFRYKTYKIFLNDNNEILSVINFDPYIEVYVEPIHWIALGSSSFITVALSLERFLAVKYPLLIKKKCTRAVAILCVGVLVTVAGVITVPYFTSYTITVVDFEGLRVSVATVTETGRSTLFPCIFHDYIMPIMWYITPWAILAVLNILLSIHVKLSTRIRAGLPNISNPNRNLTVLIVLIVTVYMLCNFPKCAFMFYKLVKLRSSKQVCIDANSKLNYDQNKVYLVVEVMTELLNVLNSCVNFIVYCLAGTRFRRELKKLLTCQRRIHPINNIKPVHQMTITEKRTQAGPSSSQIITGVTGRTTLSSHGTKVETETRI